MYFCQDADLAVWEAGIFSEGAFGQQAIVEEATGTLTGDGLVMDSAVLGDVLPGMVATVGQASGTVSQLLEVVSIADASHATVSMLRGKESEDAVAAAVVNGSVKVTVVSFRPQIAAVGDELLGLVGVASDRGVADADLPAMEKLSGFEAACVMGVLAGIFRMLSGTTEPTNVAMTKRDLYESMWQAARGRVEATVDLDGDGEAETRVRAGVRGLERE